MPQRLPITQTGLIPKLRYSILAGGAAGNHTLTGITTSDRLVFVLAFSSETTHYSQALDVASVAANTSAEQTFTVTGLATTDVVFVNKPSLDAGLGVVNARVSAADTLALTFMNATGSPIDPASETYEIVAMSNTGLAAGGDLTSEFSIDSDDTIDNAAGTDTSGDLLLVVWYDDDWGQSTGEPIA